MDFNIEALLQKPSEVNSGTIYFIKENDNVNLYLGTSDNNLQYIGQSLGDKSILPKELQGKNVMEMFSYLFQYANSNKSQNNELKLLVGNAIGTNYTTKNNEEIKNDILQIKQLIVKSLKNKGVIANEFEPLVTYSDKINSIIQDGRLKNTKLNIIAPYIKEIPLSKKIPLENLCTTVLEYEKGSNDIVHYECNFDNSDKINFIYNDTIEYNNGKMQQKLKIEDYDKIKEKVINNKQEYISNVNLFDFYVIKNFNDDDCLQIQGDYYPTLVKAKNDINLSQVESINKINWIANGVLLLFSFNSGLTWNTYDINNKKNIYVDINNLSDVKNNALTIDEINNLTEEDLRNLINQNVKIRFAYYFDAKLDNDIYNDKISIIVSMIGKSTISKNVDIQLSADGQTIVYKINKDGTYTIVYYDVLE